MGLKEYIHKKEQTLRRKAADEANKKNGTKELVADDIRDQRKAATIHYKKLIRQLSALDAPFDLFKVNPKDYLDFEYELDIDVEDNLSQYFLNLDLNDETQEATICLSSQDCKKVSKARVPYHNFLEISSLEDILEKLLTEIDVACK